MGHNRSHQSSQERNAEKREFELEVKDLLYKCPIEIGQRVIYIRELAQKLLRKELDMDLFREFCKQANAIEELQTILPRVALLNKKNK